MTCKVFISPDGKHLDLDLDLALPEAESLLGLDIYSYCCVYVCPSGLSSTLRDGSVIGSGIGGRFQIHCPVQKVWVASFHCYCSEVLQGRIPFVLCDCPLHRHRTGRFTALSGMYFPLQYLSLFDAVVLKFLARILTVFSGVILL